MATILKGWKKGMSGKFSKAKSGPVYTETRTAVVFSDIKTESPAAVLYTTGLPRVGLTTLSGIANSICTDVNPKQDTGSPYLWTVDCEFSTATEDQDTGDNPDPTTWTPRYSGKIETYPEVMYQDLSSPPLPYVNSAGKKFPEPLIRNRPIIVYSFKQYIVSTITDVQIGEFNDTINLNTFKGFAADTLKCTISEFERGYFYAMNCTVLSVSVAYKRDKWLDQPLDMGYEYRPTAGAVAVGSAGGMLVSLNSDGTLRSDVSPPLAKTFVPHKRVAFNTFLR
jgi:hypothetical protein